MRLFYVDDDRVNTLLFEEACRAAGLAVACADCGSDALRDVAAAAPDVLVVDLHLPDTDGYRLLPALRAVLGRDVPAVLCTADDPAAVAAAAAAAGYAGCWCKPVDGRRLRDALAQLLPA